MASHLKNSNYILILTFAFITSCKNKIDDSKNKIQDSSTITVNTEKLLPVYISNNKSYSLTTSNHIPFKIKGENFNFETTIEPQKETIELKWKLIEFNIPSTWEYAFCDNTGCYLELPKENKLNSIFKKSSSDDKQLKLQLTTNGLSGTASLKFVFFTEKNQMTDTIFFEAKK